MEISKVIEFNEIETFIVKKIKKIIEQKAYCEIYFVGGSVRDKLLKKNSIDFDISCQGNIKNQFIFDLHAEFQYSKERLAAEMPPLKFERALDPFIIAQEPSAGTRVDSFILMKNPQTGDDDQRYKIDIREIKDSSVQSDALSRDFTINAIFYDILNDKIVDPFNA